MTEIDAIYEYSIEEIIKLVKIGIEQAKFPTAADEEVQLELRLVNLIDSITKIVCNRLSISMFESH